MNIFSSLLKKSKWLICIAFFLLLTGCENANVIISGIEEREANLIVVFLESKGVKAQKLKSAAAAGGMGGQETTQKFDIAVEEHQTIEAMSILNRNGLPRKQGTNLLDLFAKQGLMTSDKEETIRYQAGLAQQITNTILMIDGVIDASLQLSFPPEETGIGETQKEPITAAIYVKHQGIYDDPNAHLENKIKRIVSGSVTGLDINNVTVISDRSRFTDVTTDQAFDKMGMEPKEYVSIWNIVLNKHSAARFRTIFFFLIFFGIVFAVIMGWLFWKFYPILRKKGGFKELLNATPITNLEGKNSKPPES
jgi:type III secretion protein J